MGLSTIASPCVVAGRRLAIRCRVRTVSSATNRPIRSRDPSHVRPADSVTPDSWRSRRSRSLRRIASMRSAERITRSGRKSRIGVFLARICLAIDDCSRMRWSASASRIAASPSSPSSESKYTIARFSSGSTSIPVIDTSDRRSSSMRTSSSAMISRKVAPTRAPRGYFGVLLRDELLLPLRCLPAIFRLLEVSNVDRCARTASQVKSGLSRSERLSSAMPDIVAMVSTASHNLSASSPFGAFAMTGPK